MSVSIRKIDGVESVTVSLNEGLARVTLKAGNTVSLGQIREVVKRNGFTPQQATVKAEAEVMGPTDRPQIKIRGVAETYHVTAVAGGVTGADVMKHAGTTIHVEGVIPMPTGTQVPTIRATSIRP